MNHFFSSASPAVNAMFCCCWSCYFIMCFYSWMADCGKFWHFTLGCEGFVLLFILRNGINLRLASNKKRYIFVRLGRAGLFMLLFFLPLKSKSFDTIIMISKYTFAACRAELYLLINSDKRTNKTQDVHFVYSSLHWHFRRNSVK